MPPKPDPTQHTLMHFLDRFVYRSARTKSSAAMHGSSIMQPTAGSEAADLLVKPGQTPSAGRVDLNSESFWKKKVADVAAEDVFFHQYFNSAGNKKRRGGEKKDKMERKTRDGDESGSDDEGEEEIWKAITASKPEVEGGDDEDDDLSMGDLESAYGDSENDDEGGIDLGGADDEDANGGALVLDDGSDAEDMDAMPDLDDDEEDAMFDDDEEVPAEFEDFGGDFEESELSRNQKKRKERKKLKALPVFASAEDYARLLGRQDEEEDDGVYD